MKFCRLCAFLVPISSFATMQRFEILGINKTGSIIALATTHFAPASFAPIASVMDLFGDEERLQTLKKQVITDTSIDLSNLGITASKILPMISISSKFDNQI